MATKTVDNVTSRLTPLPQQSHWRRGQEAPSPTLKVTTIRILNIFSLPWVWIHFVRRDQNPLAKLKIKLDLSISTLKSDPIGFYPPASSRRVDLQVLAGILYENK